MAQKGDISRFSNRFMGRPTNSSPSTSADYFIPKATLFIRNILFFHFLFHNFVSWNYILVT